MRFARTYLPAFLLLHPAFPLLAQQPTPANQTPQRDQQATALLLRAVQAMGGIVPADSVAAGNIVIVAGSETSAGTIRILTRGTDQSSEQITLPQSTQTIIYSRNTANEIDSGNKTNFPLEKSVTSQSSCFPIPFLSSALANSDESIQYIGSETLGQEQVQHIRFWNTFASQPRIRHIAEFSAIDIWLDATSTLPQRISFIRRDAGGASPKITVDVYFSNYQNVGGLAYPFLIRQLLDGSPWITITISNVAFNTGLTDANFPVQ